MTSRFRSKDGSTYETDYSTNHQECDEPGCEVVLFWTDDGREGCGDDFNAANCECVTPCRTCVDHRHSYICPLRYRVRQ